MNNDNGITIQLHGSSMKWESFCTGGCGGQNQNKKKKGVRVRHLPSGAIGEGREFKSKRQNEKAAVRRLAGSTRFRRWAKLEIAARAQGYAGVEARIDAMLRGENLRVEVFSDTEWVLT